MARLDRGIRHIQKRPRGSPGSSFILFPFLDDRLAARTVIVFLLDEGRAVCRLTFLDYGVTFTNLVTVVIAALTNGHSGAARADANTDANFVRESRRGEDTSSTSPLRAIDTRQSSGLLQRLRLVPRRSHPKPHVGCANTEAI
jgi:hypothetical protein